MFINLDKVKPVGQKSTIVSCPACKQRACSACKVDHEGMTCAQYAAIPEEERNPEDYVFHVAASQNGYARCGKCKHYIERINGCNRVSCRCGYAVCYKCKSSIPCKCYTY